MHAQLYGSLFLFYNFFFCALSPGIFGKSVPPDGLFVREVWDVGNTVVTIPGK